MNKKSTSIRPISEGVKNVAENRKSLTPIVLGMPNSYGVKFSVNMTSEDKKELLIKLEEWRKARKQKLAARILAKQKQAIKPNAAAPPIPLKSKPISKEGNASSKFQDRQTVFERLYQSSAKINKQEVIASCNKQQTTDAFVRKSVFLTSDKSSKPENAGLAEKDKIETLHTISKLDSDSEIKEKALPLVEISAQNYNSVYDSGKPETEVVENCFFETKEKSEKAIEFRKPLHLINDQIKIMHGGYYKSGSAPKSCSIKAVETEKDKTLLRRSISMTFRQKRRAENTMRRSVSAKNLNEIIVNEPKGGHRSLQTLQRHYPDAKKKKNESVAKSVAFTTPKNAKLLSSTYLRTKLEAWLKLNGHSLERYRHLRCFGITDNGKSFEEAPAVALNHSFENSYYATAPNTPEVDLEKENMTPQTMTKEVDLKDVEKWLEELHALIAKLKYPPVRCEEWLAAIRKKCSSCSQLPIYWECLAALHESKGDLKSAIEDYERAIIKGGEVDTVGESLAQLFDKMVIEQQKPSKPKLEKGLDPKNIFKSTIIKFALQQKAIKKLSSGIEPGIRQQLYIATPVRRSTRLQTPFKSTDEIASLQTLTPEFRKNVAFKPNKSLISGD